MTFSFAIEDSFDMAVYLADTMDTPVYLYDRPWNRTFNRNRKIKRFQNWEDVIGDAP